LLQERKEIIEKAPVLESYMRSGILSRLQRHCSYCGARFGVACTNGTTALHLALAALGVGPGDEVIIPTLTIMSCVLAVLYTGATLVLVDSESLTGNMDVNQAAARITGRTRAIMPVHLYGHPVDMDPLLELARAHRLKVVEDAAEVHGAEYRGRRVGALGDIGCFSFYANKIVTTGEGGMIVTCDPDLADRARRLRNVAHSPQQRFVHDMLGFNYRLTNVQAAIGLAQLERIDTHGNHQLH
jgi:perosamine synthetase